MVCKLGRANGILHAAKLFSQNEKFKTFPDKNKYRIHF
jgi:hypothetical protein